MTTGSIERTRTDLVQGLFEELLQFSRALRARSGDWGHALPDLSRGDLVTLGVIERGGSMRPGHIALALEVDPSVVSRQLAALGKQGLVARDTDPHDRRAELVSVTRLGRERLLQARATMCGVLADRVAAWDAETLATASSVLEDLSRVLSDASAPSNTARTTHTTKEDHV